MLYVPHNRNLKHTKKQKDKIIVCFTCLTLYPQACSLLSSTRWSTRTARAVTTRRRRRRVLATPLRNVAGCSSHQLEGKQIEQENKETGGGVDAMMSYILVGRDSSAAHAEYVKHVANRMLCILARNQFPVWCQVFQ